MLPAEFDGTGAVSAPWAGEERRFRLAIAELREHDGIVQAKPSTVAGRLSGGLWRVGDLRATLLLGLIGGGMARNEASALVRRAIDEVPFWQLPLYADTALLILAAAVSGPEGGGEAQADQEDHEASARLPFPLMLQIGAAMGFTPEEVGKMSLWEFQQAQEGFLAANGHGSEPPMPSDERYQELMEQPGG